MKESAKTLAFIIVAATCLGAAWMGRTAPVEQEMPDQVGQSLFPDFDDPFAAKRMEIISYDETLDVMKDFAVAQVGGQWVIPSHDNYPADAEERLKNAATLLVDLRVISVVSDRREDHKLFGVIEPDKNATQVGEEGVGKVISFRGENNERLAELIIGRDVQASESQYYVRVPGRDIVYVVKIDPTQISTRFEDWIKQDLLEVSDFDITEMEIRDYSVEPTLTTQGLQLQLEPRFESAVTWNADDYQWELKALREFRRTEYESRELRDDEELDRTNLDNMKNAIDDLKIVDVLRKPAGLRASSATATPIWRDREALQSLQEHGFYAQRTADNQLKLYCSDGEVDIRTKNGVEYTLWFGAQAATVDAAGDSQLNRYVMISAQLNPNAFKKPELELPPEPSLTPSPQDANEGESSMAAAGSQDDPPTDALTDVDSETESSEAATDTTQEADAERDRLIKEYERKLEEYNENVKKAEAEARDLNSRLGDWYFVVDEEVYSKIRLRKSQVIKQKETIEPDQGTGIEAFRSLEGAGPAKDSE